MKLILFLLKASWRTVLLATLAGGASGGASIGLLILIVTAMRQPGAPSWLIAGLFAALCAVVIATRIGSNVLLRRLTQQSISRLRMGLCRQILNAPLRQLEEIGTHRILGTLTDDVGVISGAMKVVPALAVNIVMLIGGAVYLGSLNPGVLAALVVFAILGVGTYRYASRFAMRYGKRSREAFDVWLRHIRALVHGVKELKMHYDRRREFTEEILDPAEATCRESKILCETTFDAAVVWGRSLFFVAIGLLLFVLPHITILHIDKTVLAGCGFTMLFLISPLEQLVAWMPSMTHASVSVAHIEQLGLMLDRAGSEESPVARVGGWEQIELAGVTHAYRREGHSRGFVLGPIDFSLRRGEILFIVGGNGSGKTTLAKLLTGLYTPETGEIRLDGCPVTTENREGYRQLFSAVFDDAAVFEGLWGLGALDLDERAREYLEHLELDRIVSVPRRRVFHHGRVARAAEAIGPGHGLSRRSSDLSLRRVGSRPGSRFPQDFLHGIASGTEAPRKGGHCDHSR